MTSRSRRSVPDKSGRLAALAKFREMKETGVRNDDDDGTDLDSKPIYEVVDEEEYSKIVRQRLEDDWIVDDDGSGYVEDGRDYFDDEENAIRFRRSRGKRKGGGGDGGDDDEGPERKRKSTGGLSRFIQRPGGSTIDAVSRSHSLKRPKPFGKSNATAPGGGDDLLEEMLDQLKSESSPMSANRPKKQSASSLFARPPPTTTTTTTTTMTASPLSLKKPIDLHKETAKPTPSIKEEIQDDDDDVVTDNDLLAMSEPEPIEPVRIVSETTESTTPTNNDKFQCNQPASAGGSLAKWQNVQMDAAPVATAVKKETVGESQTADLVEERFVSHGQFCADAGESVAREIDGLDQIDGSVGDELKLFWLDAYEDFQKHAGHVYLFGKTWNAEENCFESCCVLLEGIERQIFLLPRPYRLDSAETAVGLHDVYKEFDEDVASKYRINKFLCKQVQRSYAFEKADVPNSVDVLEILYSPDCPQLPSDLTGNTFSHVFGTTSSSLERLLLERRIRGPCWLSITGHQKTAQQISWCKKEYSLTSMKTVNVLSSGADKSLPVPPLTFVSLKVETVVNLHTHRNEIVALSLLINPSFRLDQAPPKNAQLYQDHICFVTRTTELPLPQEFHGILLKRQNMRNASKIKDLPNEKAMLNCFLGRLRSIDPDLLVGHEIASFDLDVIIQRCEHHKIAGSWSVLGRLQRIGAPPTLNARALGFNRIAPLLAGRLVCDAKVSAKELIRAKSYELTALVEQVLHCERPETTASIRDALILGASSLLRRCDQVLMDALYSLRLVVELNVLPLALQVTKICGNILSRTLQAGRSERNEFLLLHAFYERDYLLPDKSAYARLAQPKSPTKRGRAKNKKTNKTASQDVDVAAAVGSDDEEVHEVKTTDHSGRKKPSYAGGLVLEPKKGFYDHFILLLDFNSLYPSIIQEYNICFTTVDRQLVFATSTSTSTGDQSDDIDMDRLLDAMADGRLIPSDAEAGILPTEIRKLVDSRRQVKQLMKGAGVSADQMAQYDIRQKALKLTANSMYGCLGFAQSRFYAKPLAALVTAKGRETLMRTKDLVERLMSLEVVYGDTDSIMVNTNLTDLDEAFKLGNKIKTEVNKLFRLLEIDIDGVFKSLLLLKKKKYAALTIERGPDGKVRTHEELKGLDIVRRDWSGVAVAAGKFVVSELLSGRAGDSVIENIHTRLSDVATKMRSTDQLCDEKDYCITKQLTKDPEKYADVKSLPHVQVALRLNSLATDSGRKFHSGDTVEYVVCLDGTNSAATQRSYALSELRQRRNELSIDIDYYLSQQIHPVVARLCEPIAGTSSAQIAECLGLDPSPYLRQAAAASAGGVGDAVDDFDGHPVLTVDDVERFRLCDRFVFKCPACCCEQTVESPFVGQGVFIECAMLQCSNQDCAVVFHETPTYRAKIRNQLTMQIRSLVQRYQQGWMTCDDSVCAHRTRRVPMRFAKGSRPICPQCDGNGTLRLDYAEHDLYNQLCFFEHLFDVDRALKNIDLPEQRDIAEQKLTAPMGSFNQELLAVVREPLSLNAYKDVNLGHVFSHFRRLRVSAAS